MASPQTPTTAAAAIANRWHKEVAILEQGNFVALASPLVMDKRIDKAVRGKEHHWRVLPNATAGDISSTAGTFSDNLDTETDVTLTVNKFKVYSAVFLGSIEEALSDADFSTDYRQVASQALSAAMETDILAEVADSTLTDAGDVTREIVFDDFLQALQTLLDNYTPLGPGSGLTAIVTPTTFTKMASLSQFNDASIRGESKSVLGQGLGPNGKTYFSPLGAECHVSQYLPANGAGKSCVLGVKDSLISLASPSPRTGSVSLIGGSTALDGNRFYAIRYYGTQARKVTRFVEIGVKA